MAETRWGVAGTLVLMLVLLVAVAVDDVVEVVAAVVRGLLTGAGHHSTVAVPFPMLFGLRHCLDVGMKSEVQPEPSST